jgi:hypothetical protein
MDEFECMRMIDNGLQAVTDDATRLRIANWVASKYLGAAAVAVNVRKGASASDRSHLEPSEREGEIAGIAKLSQSGEVMLTVRDFKAKSANDAAVRLVHVLIWATGKLTKLASLSSKNVVVPWLRKYRCYDGNTRWAISKDKGLVRDGDELSLDFHAEQLAQKFVAEIQDASIEGKWKPSSTVKRRLSKPSNESTAGAE